MIYEMNDESISLGCLEGKTIYQIVVNIINSQNRFDYIQKLLGDFEESEDCIYKLKQDHIARSIDLTIVTDKDTETVRHMLEPIGEGHITFCTPCREPIPKLAYSEPHDWIKKAHKEMLSYQY